VPVTGYEWHHMIRQTPGAGGAVTYDLRDVFTDCKGPSRTRYEPRVELDRREDVNRRARSQFYGVRLGVQLTIDILTFAEQASLAAIVSKMLREDYVQEWSPDAGATFYEVELVSYSGPDPLGGKTFAGGRFELALRTVELLEEVPAIATSLGTPIYVDNGNSLPADASAWPNCFFTVHQPGVEDRTYQSLRSAAGVWNWIGPIVVGGP
jgi:hypothetical protein